MCGVLGWQGRRPDRLGIGPSPGLVRGAGVDVGRTGTAAKPVGSTTAVAGLPCAIATGGSRDQVHHSLKVAGLWTAEDDTHFKAVVTADDVARGKPHPETYLKAAAALGVAPEDCVGYEDALLGMQSIRAAGFMKAVDVTRIPG